MTFDSANILWFIAVPAVVATAAAIASSASPARIASLVCAAGWSLAVVAALLATQGWQWWHDEAWCRALWPILAWAVLISGSAKQPQSDSLQHDPSPPCRWVLAGVIATLTALVAMPTGEQWSDTLPIQPVWMCFIATSCLLNAFSLECLARRDGQPWCLFAALAGFGGPMALAVATYASLAEWTLAMIAATFAVASLGIFQRFKHVWVVAFPATAAATSMVAAGRFYTYEEYSFTIYAAMLYVPTLVAIVDRPLAGRKAWLRVVTAGLVSSGLVGYCVWSILLKPLPV